jgi:hypothetical protein
MITDEEARERAMFAAMRDMKQAAEEAAERHSICLRCLLEEFIDIAGGAIERGQIDHDDTGEEQWTQ